MKKLKINKLLWIEIFKIIQRVIMVALTLLMLWAMQYVGTEIAYMSAKINTMSMQLAEANTQIQDLVKQIEDKGGAMVGVIDRLEKRLGRSWFF